MKRKRKFQGRRKWPQPWDQLRCACRMGHLDVVQSLLQKNKADPKVHARITRSTALHLAAMNGHADVAKVLLENCADVNAVDAEKQAGTSLRS